MNNQVATTKTKNELQPLPVIDREALQSLLPEERTLIAAALQPKIKKVPALDVVTELITIITTVYTIAGQSADDKTLAIYADEFYNKLLQSFPNVTIDEVRLALKSGVYGEYGEYFGLNVKTFVQFLKGYLNTHQRNEARKLFEDKRLRLSLQSEYTDEQKAQMNRDFCNELYNDFLKDRLVSDYIPAFIFDFLQRAKVLLLTKDEKAAVKERARSYYLNLASASKIAVKLFNVPSSNLMTTDDPETRLKNIAKQFAVYDFFHACKDKHQTIIFE